MDFKQIEAFITVTELKSFSKAASSLYISQPTISSYILSLERELGLQLFDRSCKEICPTPGGRLFLSYAREIIRTKTEAITAIKYFETSIGGTLSLSASTTPCNTLLPALVKSFSSLYPQVHYEVKEEGTGKIIENILNNISEIGFTGDVIANDHLTFFALMEEDLVLISNPSIGLPEEISLDMLMTLPFIVREQGSATRKTFESSLEKAGYKPQHLNIICQVNSLDTQLQWVKNGMGVSVVSKSIGDSYLTYGAIRESLVQDFSVKRGIYMVFNERRTLSPVAKAFTSFVREYINK